MIIHDGALPVAEWQLTTPTPPKHDDFPPPFSQPLLTMVTANSGTSALAGVGRVFSRAVSASRCSPFCACRCHIQGHAPYTPVCPTSEKEAILQKENRTHTPKIAGTRHAQGSTLHGARRDCHSRARAPRMRPSNSLLISPCARTRP